MLALRSTGLEVERVGAMADEPAPTPERLLRPEIREQVAYPVADASGFIKLDAMENPYAWPGELTESWLERLRGVELNRYPDPYCRELKAALSTAMEVPAGADLLVGNGSDELIQLLTVAIAEHGRTVLAPEPTFVMYRLISSWLGLRYQKVPLGADFGLDSEAMLAAMRSIEPALVWLAYPNNPTGNLFSRERVEELIRRAPGLVVMDEAYHAFAGESFLPAVLDYPNLLVLRTLSKAGLAGLRLGVLIGHPRWIEELEKLRLPYNINTLTQLSARFALEHAERMAAQAALIREQRQRLFEELTHVPGISPFPSAANFLLFRVSARAPRAVFEGLCQRGVLIKLMRGSGVDGCLRVTVGSPSENARFLAALHEVCAATKD